MLGKEGLFQTRIAGTGIAVLYSPVPHKEIQRQDLVNEKLWVDGNFVLMRSESVSFRKLTDSLRINTKFPSTHSFSLTRSCR